MMVDGHVVAFFFFNDTATTEIYTLSLHDALPILAPSFRRSVARLATIVAGCSIIGCGQNATADSVTPPPANAPFSYQRSEEHTSELQSRQYLVCRLLLEKKQIPATSTHSVTFSTA